MGSPAHCQHPGALWAAPRSPLGSSLHKQPAGAVQKQTAHSPQCTSPNAKIISLKHSEMSRDTSPGSAPSALRPSRSVTLTPAGSLRKKLDLT